MIYGVMFNLVNFKIGVSILQIQHVHVLLVENNLPTFLLDHQVTQIN